MTWFTDAGSPQCVLLNAGGHELTAFNLIIEQIIESQHQYDLAFVDDTRTTSPKVAIHSWVEMDRPRSVGRRKK